MQEDWCTRRLGVRRVWRAEIGQGGGQWRAPWNFCRYGSASARMATLSRLETLFSRSFCVRGVFVSPCQSTSTSQRCRKRITHSLSSGTASTCIVSSQTAEEASGFAPPARGGKKREFVGGQARTSPARAVAETFSAWPRAMPTALRVGLARAGAGRARADLTLPGRAPWRATGVPTATDAMFICSRRVARMVSGGGARRDGGCATARVGRGASGDSSRELAQGRARRSPRDAEWAYREVLASVIITQCSEALRASSGPQCSLGYSFLLRRR